jgi:hypothetical protein
MGGGGGGGGGGEGVLYLHDKADNQILFPTRECHIPIHIYMYS